MISPETDNPTVSSSSTLLPPEVRGHSATSGGRAPRFASSSRTPNCSGCSNGSGYRHSVACNERYASMQSPTSTADATSSTAPPASSSSGQTSRRRLPRLLHPRQMRLPRGRLPLRQVRRRLRLRRNALLTVMFVISPVKYHVVYDFPTNVHPTPSTKV